MGKYNSWINTRNNNSGYQKNFEKGFGLLRNIIIIIIIVMFNKNSKKKPLFGLEI